jgi:hypothetical protein
MSKNQYPTFAMIALLLATPAFATAAETSNNFAASYDPQLDCFGVKTLVPPLTVYERVKMDMELGEVSNLVAKFAKSDDWAAVNIGENGDAKNVSIIWKWYISYTDLEDRTGESATLKIHVINYRVAAVELEQIILTRDGIERRSREKSTLQYIADKVNKK